VLTEKKLSDDAENNPAIASVDSNDKAAFLWQDFSTTSQ